MDQNMLGFALLSLNGKGDRSGLVWGCLTTRHNWIRSKWKVFQHYPWTTIMTCTACKTDKPWQHIDWAKPELSPTSLGRADEVCWDHMFQLLHRPKVEVSSSTQPRWMQIWCLPLWSSAAWPSPRPRLRHSWSQPSEHLRLLSWESSGRHRRWHDGGNGGQVRFEAFICWA